MIERFVDRAVDVGAEVHRGQAARRFLDGLAESNPNLRVAEGAADLTGLVPSACVDTVSDLTVLEETGPLVGVIGAAAGIAETGSALFVHDDINAVWLTAMADRLVVVLTEESVVDSLAGAAPMLSGLSASGRIWTLLTGPSRTADIERILTIGVHGCIDMDLVLV